MTISKHIPFAARIIATALLLGLAMWSAGLIWNAKTVAVIARTV